MPYTTTPDGVPIFSGPISPNIGRQDLAELLPPQARARLEGWRDDRSDASAAYRAVSDQMTDLRQAVVTAEGNLRALDGGFPAMRVQPGGTPPYDWEKAVASRQADLSRAEAKLRKAQERADAHAAVGQAIGGVIDRAEHYLRRIGTPAALADAKAPAPAKTMTLEAARERVDSLRAEIERVNAAPVPASAARAKARAEIEALAARGAPNVFGLLDGNGGIRWPAAAIELGPVMPRAFADNGQVLPVLLGDLKAHDALAVVAWAMKDQLMAAVEREIGEAADDEAALSDEERARRIGELRDQLLAAERVEVAVTERDGGIPRRELDPRALLVIEGPALRDD